LQGNQLSKNTRIRLKQSTTKYENMKTRNMKKHALCRCSKSRSWLSRPKWEGQACKLTFIIIQHQQRQFGHSKNTEGVPVISPRVERMPAVSALHEDKQELFRDVAAASLTLHSSQVHRSHSSIIYLPSLPLSDLTETTHMKSETSEMCIHNITSPPQTGSTKGT